MSAEPKKDDHGKDAPKKSIAAKLGDVAVVVLAGVIFLWVLSVLVPMGFDALGSILENIGLSLTNSMARGLRVLTRGLDNLFSEIRNLFRLLAFMTFGAFILYLIVLMVKDMMGKKNDGGGHAPPPAKPADGKKPDEPAKSH